MAEEYNTNGESGRGNPDTQRAAERYLRAGLAVIPVAPGKKNPDRRGWQNERWTVEDVPREWNNGQNIGVLTGEPSGWLVDVDLDCPEADKIAGRFLDPTLTSGRESTPDAHWWYRSEAVQSTTFEDLDGEMILEIRSNGRQTVVAPSRHPSGERYLWSASGLEFGNMAAESLLRACRELATAALVARVLPSGGRHRFGLALAGFLLRRGLDAEATEKIMHAAWDAAGFSTERARRESHDDIAGIVEDTAEGLEAGAEVSGGPTLDELRPGLPRKIARFWRWPRRDPERPPPTTERGVSDSFHLTDLGNAERLVAHHGGDLRYCHAWRKWLVWDGKRWAVDDSGEVERRAKATVRAMFHEADPDNETLAKHALRSNSRTRIEAMIALARSEPGIPASPDELDTEPWLLNCENGTIDLRTGELRPHRREDLITRMAPVEYVSVAQAPRFERFLREIFDGDEALISFVQRFAGYSLTGSTEERALAILHGRGKNGKTTLVELLQDVIGDYATTTDTETILAKRYQGVGNDVAALKGARFVSTAEVEQGRALAESKVKSLTGSDTVTARFLYAEPFSFKPEFKLWLSTNNKPVIRGTDDAIWDRIRLIPFTQRFEGEAADSRLPEKLRDELPGVLAWMVQGCVGWQRDGLGEPEKVLDATKGYRAEMDTLAAFVDEECIVRPEAWCKFADLYTSYTRWCEESNEQPEKKRRFADSLTERGFEKGTGSKGIKIRRGIALRSDDDPDPARVTDPTPKSGGSGPDSPSSSGEIGNPVTDHPTSATRENTWKTEDSDERVTEGYRQSNNFSPSLCVGESLRKTVTLGNSVTPGPEKEPGSTPRGGTDRPLTRDETQRVRQLVHQGMKPEWARREVLASDHPLDCPCEACA